MLMLPEHLVAEVLRRLDDASLTAEVVFAVVQREVRGEIAVKIPGLLGGFGDEAAAVLGIDAATGAAVAVVVQAVADVEIFWRHDAHRFEQPPLRADAW